MGDDGKDWPFREVPVSRQLAEREVDEWQRSAHNASQAKVVHTAHVDMFVSVMRIKFAWAIFILIVCWLIADMVFIMSSGLQKLCIRELYALVGAVLGMIIGIMYGQSVRTKRLLKDIKSEYNMEYDDQYAADRKLKYKDRNVQLRTWRGVGTLECVAPMLLLGMVSGYVYAHMVHGNQQVVNFPKLDKEVLITLITTTTASVIGILAIVLHWLFPQAKKKKR